MLTGTQDAEFIQTLEDERYDIATLATTDPGTLRTVGIPLGSAQRIVNAAWTSNSLFSPPL
jgi:hypothetical protein